MRVDRQDILHCKHVMKKHGTHYYFATRIFPKDMRLATYVVYAFFREADEIVDNPMHDNIEQTRHALHAFRQQWKRAYTGTQVDQPTLRATAAVFHQYNIPSTYAEAFLDAMEQDLTKTRYKTYKELEQYMYGSAAAVGLIMSYIIGFQKDALPYAEKLGYAMQLTNFVRDIGEDIDTRNRVYIPQDIQQIFHISEDMIQNRMWNDDFEACVKHILGIADILYDDARKGIPLLAKRGQFPVLLASYVYQAIHVELEQQGWNPFVKKARVSFLKKCYLAIQLCLQKKSMPSS